jgi:hypothetical protein
MGTKLVELFANRVVERRILIMTIYGGELALRVLGGVDSGRVCAFELFLALLCHFGLVCRFLCLLLGLQHFPFTR